MPLLVRMPNCLQEGALHCAAAAPPASTTAACCAGCSARRELGGDALGLQVGLVGRHLCNLQTGLAERLAACSSGSGRNERANPVVHAHPLQRAGEPADVRAVHGAVAGPHHRCGCLPGTAAALLQAWDGSASERCVSTQLAPQGFHLRPWPCNLTAPTSHPLSLFTALALPLPNPQSAYPSCWKRPQPGSKARQQAGQTRLRWRLHWCSYGSATRRWRSW